jgi:DNA-binding transcriptional LysR family regulator
VFPKIELRHLQAVVVVAEELNFTRAAHRLHITQPTLSFQITEVEKLNGIQLFARGKGREVKLTDAGRAFVEEARSALCHAERAIHLARAASEDCENALVMGHSPHVDHAWISTALAIRLPLYPNLKVRLTTGFALDLIRNVLAGELNFALVLSPPETSQITAVPFAGAPLYAALPENHPAAGKDRLMLRDLASDKWILFAKQVHPAVRDTILETAERESIDPEVAHDIFTAQQAFYLVSEHMGIAILTDPTALGFSANGVVIRPMTEESLWFETCLVMRANDDSRPVNEFARAFLRRYEVPRAQPKQMELSLSA